MSGEIVQFPRVSELAEAYAHLLAANAMFMKMTDIPEYVEEHRLNSGVDMDPYIWLRYVLIKMTRIDPSKSMFQNTEPARRAAIRYISKVRRQIDEDTG